VLEFSAEDIRPHVSWGTSPEMVVAIDARVSSRCFITGECRRVGNQSSACRRAPSQRVESQWLSVSSFLTLQ
jgi:homoaconitase/3-isopropylmalate dehydratase large subunit